MGKRNTLIFLALVVVVCGAAAWAILSVPYVPTNDGPQMVLTVHMEENYAGSVYEKQFSLGYQLGSRGFAILYAPLYGVMGWAAALSVFECLLVLLTGFGVMALAHVLQPKRRGAALVAFPLALSWVFYMGFLNFAVGMAVGLFVLAWVSYRRPPNITVRAGISAALWVQCFCHVVTAAVTGAIMAAVVLTRAWASPDEGAMRRELTWLSITGAPISVLLFILRNATDDLARVAHSSTMDFRSVGDVAAQTPHILAPGVVWRGGIALAVVVLALGSFLWRERRVAAKVEEKALAACALVLLLIGALGPLHVPGWQYVAPRFSVMGLLLCISLLPIERVPARRHVVLGGLTAISVLLSAGAQELHHRLFGACSDAYAGLEAPLRRRFMQLPITFDATCGLPRRPNSEVPYQQAGIHLGTLYAVAHGGGVPWAFSGHPAVHAFTPRDEQLAPTPPMRLWEIGLDERVHRDASARRTALDVAALVALGYENLVVNGAREEDVAHLAARGFVADYARGSHFNGHLEPCEVKVEAGGAPDAPPPQLFVAVRPELPPIPARFVRERDLWVAPLATLCGPLSITVVRRDGSRCANADDNGRMAVVAGRDPITVVCE